MIENTQLSRPQPGDSRIGANRPSADQADKGKPSEFDQRLNDEIDQARSAKSPDENPGVPIKSEDNQSLVEEPETPVRAQPETDPARAEQPPLQPEMLLTDQQPVQTQNTDSEGVDPAEGNSQTAVWVDAEQSLPEHGKTLPLAAASGKLEMATPARTAGDKAMPARPVVPAVELSKPLQPSPTVQQASSQPSVQSASVPAGQPATEFLPPEWRLPVKGRLSLDNDKMPVVTAKTSLNMASAASAASMASVMQQVPLTTSLAAMHNPASSLPTADGFLNTLSTSSTATLAGSLNTPVQNTAWSQGVAERVAWMVQGNFQSAELKLNPAHLGPLEIKLSVQDDNKATVHFVTQHATVREALDSAMPRLRDMLENQGLNLADVNVSDSGVQGNESETQTSGEQNDPAASAVNTDASEDTLVQESMIMIDDQDGVSLYA